MEYAQQSAVCIQGMYQKSSCSKHVWPLKARRDLPGVFLNAVYGRRSRGPVVGGRCVLQPAVAGLWQPVLHGPVGLRIGSCCVQSVIVSLVCECATLTGGSLQISDS